MPPYFNQPSEGARCLQCVGTLRGASLCCADCGELAHLICSNRPTLNLVRLAITRATYVCPTCIRAKAGDKLKSILDNVEQIVLRERTEVLDRDESQDRRESSVEGDAPFSATGISDVEHAGSDREDWATAQSNSSNSWQSLSKASSLKK